MILRQHWSENWVGRSQWKLIYSFLKWSNLLLSALQGDFDCIHKFIRNTVFSFCSRQENVLPPPTIPNPQNLEMERLFQMIWVYSIESCTCSLSVYAQSCLTFCNPMDQSPPGSSVHGILQARILEWGPLLQGIVPTQELNLWLLHLLHCRQILYCWATREVLCHCNPRQRLLWNDWDALYTFWYIRGKIHTSYKKE